MPNTKDFAAFALNPLLAQFARISASCPVLNETVPEMETLGGSLGSSPRHQAPSRKGSGTFDLSESLLSHLNRSCNKFISRYTRLVVSTGNAKETIMDRVRRFDRHQRENETFQTKEVCPKTCLLANMIIKCVVLAYL